MNAVITTLEHDITGFLTGLEPGFANEVKALFRMMNPSELLTKLLAHFDAQIVPHEFYAGLFNLFLYESAKNEAFIATEPDGPRKDYLVAEKARLDAALATKAGSECFKEIGAIVSAGESFFASSAAPTPDTAISAAAKAVAIRGAMSAAPVTIVITANEWAQLQAQRAAAATPQDTTLDMPGASGAEDTAAPPGPGN